MNRNWMVAGAVAAVLAIVLGARLGRDLLSDDEPAAKSAGPDVVRFHETVADVSLSYPGSWIRVQSPDPEVPLLALSRDRAAVVQVRRSAAGIEQVTRDTLPIAKKITDPLFRAIKRARLLEPAAPVERGGLFGWRYRYTLGGAERARDHYFLFKGRYLIALVFEVKPASRLAALTPQFDRVAGSLRVGAPA
ncbi:MAG: hypothetical protein ACRDLS_15695 [Solirubrobacteraceae bacterium]